MPDLISEQIQREYYLQGITPNQIIEEYDSGYANQEVQDTDSISLFEAAIMSINREQSVISLPHLQILTGVVRTINNLPVKYTRTELLNQVYPFFGVTIIPAPILQRVFNIALRLAVSSKEDSDSQISNFYSVSYSELNVYANNHFVSEMIALLEHYLEIEGVDGDNFKNILSLFKDKRILKINPNNARQNVLNIVMRRGFFHG